MPQVEEDSAAGGTPEEAQEPGLSAVPVASEPSPVAPAKTEAPTEVSSQLATPAPEVEQKETPEPKEAAVPTLRVPSHKKQWNLLTRVSTGPQAVEYPEITKLFSGNKQDKLKRYACLSSMETTFCRRLMTIAQMQQERCSERLVFFICSLNLFVFVPKMKIAACVARGGVDDPDCPPW